MTVTISPSDPRSVRALAVLSTADRWVKGHRKSDGRAFFAIPGSRGRIYFTNTRDCMCPDRRERDETCKHIRAVRLWKLQHDARRPMPAPRPVPRCTHCGGPVSAGVIVGACDDCYDVADIFDGVAAIKAAFGSDAGVVVMTGGGR